MDPLSLIGKTLAGHFLVESLAGEGRFSLVYKGQHVGPQEPVALKCLKLGLELDPAAAENFLRRFREENRTHSKMSRGDPHFVRTIGSGMTTATNGAHVPYTVLEWLKGHSLAEDFRQRREAGSAGRPLKEVIDLLDGVVMALCLAHDSGASHGDLNAGNFFFVTADGAPTKLKVLDFGMAEVLSGVTNEIAPAAMKPRMFNPAYAAPEHFDPSLGAFGPWTDVYALALVVLEALRDRAAIEEDFKVAALNREARPSPRTLGIRTNAAVEAVIARALAVVPAERFQHAKAFWDALKKAAAQSTEAAKSAPPPPPPPAPLAATPTPVSVAKPIAPPVAPATPKAALLPASAFSAHGMSPSPSAPIAHGPAITLPMLQLGKPAHLAAPGALGSVSAAPVSTTLAAKLQAKRTMMGVAPPGGVSRPSSPPASPPAVAPALAAPPPPPPPPPPPGASGAAALTPLGVAGDAIPTPPPRSPAKSAPAQRGRAKVAPESENKVTVEATAPPKATVSTQDLPSVIVDEPPERQEERLLRNKQTLIIRSSSQPITPVPNWVPEPPPAGFAGPVVPATSMPIAESAYERRPSRTRRRLMVVAIIMFILVFIGGGAILGMNWYLARRHRALPTAPFLNP